eukprot:1204540-Rhodomonas_salina.1
MTQRVHSGTTRGATRRANAAFQAARTQRLIPSGAENAAFRFSEHVVSSARSGGAHQVVEAE